MARANQDPRRTERIEVRVAPDVRRAIEAAADRLGMSVSKYIRASALAAAVTVMRRSVVR